MTPELQLFRAYCLFVGATSDFSETVMHFVSDRLDRKFDTLA